LIVNLVDFSKHLRNNLIDRFAKCEKRFCDILVHLRFLKNCTASSSIIVPYGTQAFPYTSTVQIPVEMQQALDQRPINGRRCHARKTGMTVNLSRTLNSARTGVTAPPAATGKAGAPPFARYRQSSFAAARLSQRLR
jgi:hypothetical protein